MLFQSGALLFIVVLIVVANVNKISDNADKHKEKVPRHVLKKHELFVRYLLFS